MLEVRAGLPDKAQQSMDSGEVRTGAHTLEMLGEKYPAIVAPALKLVWLLAKGLLGSKNNFGDGRKLENGQLAPLLEQHVPLKASVGWVMTEGAKLDRMVPPSTAAFFHYVFGCANAKLRDQFFSQLVTGLGLGKTHPVYHLREQLAADNAARIARSRKREHRALFIKAWNAMQDGTRVTALTFESSEVFPTLQGVKLAAAA